MSSLQPSAIMDEIAKANNEKQKQILTNWLAAKLGVAVTTYQDDFLGKVMG